MTFFWSFLVAVFEDRLHHFSRPLSARPPHVVIEVMGVRDPVTSH